jgi:uncharacterized membrane protein YgcG
MRRRLFMPKLAQAGVIVLLGVAATSIGACSASPSGPAISDTAARQLQADVLVVTQSAAAQNWSAARSQLQTLLADLAKARSARSVSVARAAEVETAAAAVNADLVAAAPRSTPTTTTTVHSPVPAASPRSKHSPGGQHGGGGGDPGGGGGGGGGGGD